MNFYRLVFPYKNKKLLCTVLISSPWKSCKFQFYPIKCFKLIVLLLIIESILFRIFLMECFKSIAVFIIDGGSDVNINMVSIKVKKCESGKRNKWCLTLDEKIEILDEAKKRKLSCRVIAKEFKIGNTLATKVLKNERTLRGEFAHFQGNRLKHINRGSHQIFKVINDIFYSWFKNCEASGIYLNGPLLIEEAMNIKQSLNQQELDGFKASEDWLAKWKLSHGTKEKQISGDSLDVSKTKIESWMEWIRELSKEYDHKDILNMDERKCFFKALPTKGLALKVEKSKGGKKSKQRFAVAFFVSADGEKVGKPIVIWWSKTPRCFRLANAAHTLIEVMHFTDWKSWMQVEIMENVLETLNRQMLQEERNVILFLDNATVHPTSLVDKFSKIKVVFLPKNTTSCLQMLESFKVSNQSIERS